MLIHSYPKKILTNSRTIYGGTVETPDPYHLIYISYFQCHNYYMTEILSVQVKVLEFSM